MAVLITGGARSGKSLFAEKYAAHQGKEGIYIATSQIFDDEMHERVSRHQLRRLDADGFHWATIEEPYERSAVLSDKANSIILIDCLTLWLSNRLLRNEHDPNAGDIVLAKVDELASVLSRHSDQVIAVTNEVGDSIVPEYPLGRQFRDLSGIMNQRIAAISNKVFLVTAGIPIELKSQAYQLPNEDHHAHSRWGQ